MAFSFLGKQHPIAFVFQWPPDWSAIGSPWLHTNGHRGNGVRMMRNDREKVEAYDLSIRVNVWTERERTSWYWTWQTQVTQTNSDPASQTPIRSSSYERSDLGIWRIRFGVQLIKRDCFKCEAEVWTDHGKDRVNDHFKTTEIGWFRKSQLPSHKRYDRHQCAHYGKIYDTHI